MIPFESATGEHPSRPAPAALLARGRAALRRWTPWALLCAVAIPLCMAFVDHPVARLVHEGFPLFRHGGRLADIPVVVLAPLTLAVVLLGVPRAMGEGWQGFRRRALYAGLALCVALTLKSEAKFVFGRLSPMEYWHHHASLWGFRPFHDEGSFPSGHMTTMSSVAPFLWRHRWLRPPYVLACLATCFGLVALQAHFVSDLVAGTLLGGTVGYLFLLAERRPRP